MSDTTTRRRAKAMAPEDRREAIVDAALPLLMARGSGVTTREIAEAAGIAEGTIFRAFADKNELVDAAIERALDPEATETALAAIDLDGDLVDRLEAAVAVLGQRVEHYAAVMAMAEGLRPGAYRPGARPSRDLARLEAILAPDRDRLRVAPAEAAGLLRGITWASVHPSFHGGRRRTPAHIVDLFLHGVTRTGEDA